ILFPLSLMAGETGDPRVYFEHSHRLFGWMVGVSTLTLAIYGLFAAPKLWLMAMPWVLGVLVVVQAIFGIIRVGDNLAALGAVHGVTAQLVFAFAVAIAVMAHRSWRETLTGPRQWRGRSTLGAVLLGAFVLQLAMGALFRHLRRGDEGGAAHAMYSHAVFSFVVVVLCVAFGAIMVKGSRETSIAGLKRIGYGLMHGVGLQFILGWAALAAILLADDRGNVPTADQLATAAVVPWWEAFVATVHQANGALLLCLATVGTVWAFRLAPRTAKAHVPTASSAAPA
ncbi:MAG: COX15/CtaA family protein, partial [Planctomycetota bacterium]